MSKKPQTNNAAANEAAANNKPATQNNAVTFEPIENASIVAEIKESMNVATADLIPLTGSGFFDFDKERERLKTNEFNFKFVEMTTFTDKETAEAKPVVKLITEFGDEVLNGDIVLVSSMKKYTDKNPGKGCVIRVVYTGEKKPGTNGGKYRNLQVYHF